MTPWSLTQQYEKKPGSRYNLFNVYIKNSHEIYSIPRQTNYLTCESRVQMKEMVMKKTQFFVWNSLFDWRNLFQSNSTENFVSSAVSMAPLSLTPRCQVKDNAELDFAVSMKLKSLTQRCQGPRNKYPICAKSELYAQIRQHMNIRPRCEKTEVKLSWNCLFNILKLSLNFTARVLSSLLSIDDLTQKGQNDPTHMQEYKKWSNTGTRKHCRTGDVHWVTGKNWNFSCKIQTPVLRFWKIIDHFLTDISWKILFDKSWEPAATFVSMMWSEGKRLLWCVKPGLPEPETPFLAGAGADFLVRLRLLLLLLLTGL